MVTFSYVIVNLPTTGKAMTVRFSEARSPSRWLVSLGIGFLAAFILPQVMPAGGALAQTGPDRKSIEKSVARLSRFCRRPYRKRQATNRQGRATASQN